MSNPFYVLATCMQWDAFGSYYYYYHSCNCSIWKELNILMMYLGRYLTDGSSTGWSNLSGSSIYSCIRELSFITGRGGRLFVGGTRIQNDWLPQGVAMRLYDVTMQIIFNPQLGGYIGSYLTTYGLVWTLQVNKQKLQEIKMGTRWMHVQFMRVPGKCLSSNGVPGAGLTAQNWPQK